MTFPEEELHRVPPQRGIDLLRSTAVQYGNIVMGIQCEDMVTGAQYGDVAAFDSFQNL